MPSPIDILFLLMKSLNKTLMLFGVGLLFFGFGCSSSSQVSVSLTDQAALNQTPELRVDINNEGRDAIEGVIVIIPTSLTEGLGIREVIPRASETYYDAKKDVLRYTFDEMVVDAGDLATVQFRMRAKEEGVFKGPVRVCLEKDCENHNVKTKLVEVGE